MSVDLLHTTKLLDELGCRLLANAGDTGNIIRGITHQSLEISNMLRPHA
ncbi:hypothetical protein ES703_122957 [subsurface metagenome]